MTRRSAKRLRRGAVTAGLGLLLAGSPLHAEDPVAPASSTNGEATSSTVHEVSQRNKSFSPGEITVTAGDEVVFLNDDEISHNVFSRSADSKFNLKIQRPDEHKSYRFETPGKSVVRCAIHPNMKLVVNVVADESAPDTAPVAAESPEGASEARVPAAPSEEVR